MAAITSVVVFDENLYRPTHLVHFWMTKVTTRFTSEAIAAAPIDTGELKSGIHGATRQIGPRQVQGLISSDAPHTMWVIRGTGFPVKGHEGRIYTTKGFRTRNPDDAYVELWGVMKTPAKFSRKGKDFRGTGYHGRRQKYLVRKRGYWLKLPFTARNGGPVFSFSVSGQEPNNFMFKAWNRTAHTHSAIRRHGAQFPEALR